MTTTPVISTMSTSTVEYTTGKGGKDNAILDGHRYSLNRRRTGTDGVRNSYWRCVVSGCQARLVLREDTVKNSSQTPSHNHEEQRAEILVHRVKKTLKEWAATTDLSTKQIVAEAIAELDLECRAKLGCRTSSLLKMARSARAAAKRHPVTK